MIEESTDREFTPDVVVETGDVVVVGDGWTMAALHTPGHTSNHTCFTLDDGTHSHDLHRRSRDGVEHHGGVAP